MSSEKYSDFCDEIAGAKPVLATSGHILMYVKFKQWSLDANEVTMIAPDLTSTYFLCDSEKPVYYEAARPVPNQKACIKESMKANLVMVPLICGQHWTLLVLDNNSGDCRYYDTLAMESARCRFHATEFLKGFGGETLTLTPHSNQAVQSRLACAFAVMHYMEAEMRFHLKQAMVGCQ